MFAELGWEEARQDLVWRKDFKDFTESLFYTTYSIKVLELTGNEWNSSNTQVQKYMFIKLPIYE